MSSRSLFCLLVSFALVGSITYTYPSEANAQQLPSNSSANGQVRSATFTLTATSTSPAVSSVTSLQDRDVLARTAWIQTVLDAESPAANQWYWSWVVLSAGAAIGQGALALLVTGTGHQREMQPGLVVGAATATIGLIPMIVWPTRAAFAAGELRTAPGATPEQRRRRLQLAERLLRESAEGEAFERSWVMHALGVAMGVGSLLVLGLGFQQWESGVISLVSGVALNEVQIWTQPTGAIEAWKNYQNHAAFLHEDTRAQVRTAQAFHFHPVVTPVCFGIEGTF